MDFVFKRETLFYFILIIIILSIIHFPAVLLLKNLNLVLIQYCQYLNLRLWVSREGNLDFYYSQTRRN